jgi:hypothetical protein
MLASLRRFARPETGFFFALWVYLLLVGQSRLLRDPGTFWHTRLGEIMLSSGHLVHGDPFGFTFNDPTAHPWIPHQWLGECLMALLHRIDGLDTLLLTTATILAALYTWLAYRLLRAGLHWAVAAVVVVLVVGASASHFHARSHLATIVFLGTTMAFLCDYEAGRIGLPRLFWLVPIYVLWTNLHGGMLGGLCTMIAATAGWSANRLLHRETPILSFRDVFSLACVIVACGLTAFVNPYGLELPHIWLKIMDAPLLPGLIQEHAPLDPTKLHGQAVLVLAAVYLAALANLRRWPRVTWLLPLLWFYLTCTRIRHAPLFSITAGLALAELLPHTRWAAQQVQSGGDLYVPPQEARSWGWRPLILPALAVGVAVCLQAQRIEVPLIGHGWARLDPEQWPTELQLELDQLQQTQPDGTPIFNELTFGGYLIYFTPKLRVFVDDRCELYGDQWLKKYVDAEDHDTAEQMRQWEREYPFALALVRTGPGFDDYFRTSTEWRAVRRTETATLYRRRAM